MRVIKSKEEWKKYSETLHSITTWRTLDNGEPDKYPCIVSTYTEYHDDGPNYFIHDFAYSEGKCECGNEKWEFD